MSQANTLKVINVHNADEGIASQLRTKLSHNLYLGLAGPIGSRLVQVRTELCSILEKHGYADVRVIKVSDFFDRIIEESKLNFSMPPRQAGPLHKFYEQYREKQEKGNFVRMTLKDNSAFASFIVREIYSMRLARGLELIPKEERPTLAQATPDQIKRAQQLASGERVAFIIDQLKRPEEVDLLRQVYGNLFFLYAVVETKRSRKINLISKGLTESEADELIDIDRQETNTWGQRVQATVLQADYFHNNNDNTDRIRTERVTRFIELIHGKNGLSPTQEEFGMYQAHSAGLGSACLSRQVGAAILDKYGNLLSIGRNDVPKFGGGLYESTDPAVVDNRCVHAGFCSNDKHKKILTDEVSQIISAYVSDPKVTEEIVTKISNSKIKDIIEYSRSIHAEMDAIISLSRKGIKIESGSVIFSTAFPCHMCARHIVTAGIEKVIYIEPYEKSLATKLHEDSLTTTEPKTDKHGKPTQMEIRSFHGVAPRRYLAFFQKNSERKLNGAAIDLDSTVLPVKDIHKHYVVPFFEIEEKCIQNLDLKLGAKPSTPAPLPNAS